MYTQMPRRFPLSGCRRLLNRQPFASSRTSISPRFFACKRSLSFLSVAVGISAAALVLTMSPANARRLRNTVRLGVLALYESEAVTSFEDIVALMTQWRETVSRGDVEEELINRLVSCIVCLQGDNHSQDAMRFYIDQGVVPLLVDYIVWSKPRDPTKLQQLVQALTILLEAATANETVELQVPLVTLAQALGLLARYEGNVVSCVDLLRLGDALVKVQELAHKRLEEGAATFRAFTIYRSDLIDPDCSQVAESCAALVTLCSREMPDSMKRIGLWALGTLVETVNREEPDVCQVEQLEAVLGPRFATMLLALPRDNALGLQLQAATVMDSLLHVAQRNPAAATRETYELWMEQICDWMDIKQSEDDLKPTKRFWCQPQSGELDCCVDKDTEEQRQTLCLQLQLISSRCIRTLTESPQSRRYVCESSRTRAALFALSRRIHEKQTNGNTGDVDLAGKLRSIQRHVSWAFRNICTGFYSGAIALHCLFDASSTASLLQSRQDLPMLRYFRGSNDLTDLPIIGAEEYEASTEFGWIDILTAWSASSDRHVRENAITSLVYLAEQPQPRNVVLMSEEEEKVICSKQEHILQAWLTSMLQQIRLLSGGELIAVKQTEEIANISKELTPGNERIMFNPAVIDAGTSALAVLAERHHAELVQQGVVPLVALLAETSATTSAQHTQCARVLANLVATCCLNIDPRRSAFSIDTARTGIVSDNVDIAKLLKKSASGRQFFGSICRWHECDDPLQRSNYFRVVQNLRAYDEVVSTGRLVKDVYCEGVHPIVSRNGTGSMEEITDEDGAVPVIDVVFVHGLRGHPFDTWRTEMSTKPGGINEIWPDVLLAKDLQISNVRARLVTLGYEAGMVSWSSPWPSLTLEERARVMLSALYAANIGRDQRHPGAPARPVVFITHSMGGLLTKKMLLLDHEQRGQFGLADSATGIIFLAVPHFGSDLAKGVRSESIRKLIRTHPAIEDLGADPDGCLKTLNDSFKMLGIDCFSVGEETASPVALGLSAVVVKANSADPGIGRFYVLPGSDHMTICKIKSRSEPLYQEILQFIVQRATANGVIHLQQ